MRYSAILACAILIASASADTSEQSQPARTQIHTAQWQAGKHYQLLRPAQPTRVKAGAVEVIEFFRYDCPHCDRLDPHLRNWNETKPSYIELEQIPGIWSDADRPYARLHYAAKALGREDLQLAIYQAVHRDHQPLAATNPKAVDETFKLQLAFVEAHGIKAADFIRAYRSPMTEELVKRAAIMSLKYKIDSVPTIVVQGKYVTSVGMAGGTPQLLFTLTNDLALTEHQSIANAR